MISFYKSTTNDFPKDYPEIVFVGRSNAGKSSLINALYKKGLAYTGKMPGKTKLINYFNVDDSYYVVDVPGYGFANRSKQEAISFANMMEAYFSKGNIALCIMIVDSRIGLTKDDLDMKEYIESINIKYLILANKIDKLSNNELFNNKNKLFKDYDNVIFISAEKRTNIDEVKNRIKEAI